MATYSWHIDRLYTKDITKDGTTYTDVVLRVTAFLRGTSENHDSVVANSGFDLDLNVDNIDSSFTLYGDITEANVISWLESKIGTDGINSAKQAIEGELEFWDAVYGANPKEDSDGNATFPW
jgi:hypothetical protein